MVAVVSAIFIPKKLSTNTAAKPATAFTTRVKKILRIDFVSKKMNEIIIRKKKIVKKREIGSIN